MSKKAIVVAGTGSELDGLRDRIKGLSLSEINRAIAYSQNECAELEKKARKLADEADKVFDDHAVAVSLIHLLTSEKSNRSAN